MKLLYCAFSYAKAWSKDGGRPWPDYFGEQSVITLKVSGRSCSAGPAGAGDAPGLHRGWPHPTRGDRQRGAAARHVGTDPGRAAHRLLRGHSLCRAARWGAAPSGDKSTLSLGIQGSVDGSLKVHAKRIGDPRTLSIVPWIPWKRYFLLDVRTEKYFTILKLLGTPR